MKTNKKNLKVVTKAVKDTKVYTFFRLEGCYSISLKDDNDAVINAIHNRGTLKVEDLNGKIIWQKQNFQN